MSEDKPQTSIIKVLVYWLVLWVLMLFIQILRIYAEFGSLGDRIYLLIDTFYQVQLYINWVISVYLIIYFIYNTLLYLGAIQYKKK